MCQQGLVGRPDNIVVVSAPMCLGDDVGNPHELEDFATEGIPPQSVRGRPQDDLAGVLAADEVPGKRSSPVAIDKENVPFGHSTGNLHGILRLKGLPEAESTAATEVSTDYQGPERHHSSSPPHLADSVGPD